MGTLHRADTPPFSILILHSVRNTELHLHLKNINNTAKMVADSLIYHPSVAHYLKYVATTVGRDKLLRTIQYFSRFYAWYLYRTNGTPGEIAPFDAIKKQFGLARKLMRVGKNVEHFKAAAIAADSKSLDPVIKYCAVGRQLGYAGYLSLDAVTYLDAAGVVAAKRIEKERAAINLQLLSDLCDLTIPTSAIGLTSFDDGFVGLAGTVSSLIGVYSVWKKTA